MGTDECLLNSAVACSPCRNLAMDIHSDSAITALSRQVTIFSFLKTIPFSLD
jgi:hypothetical protein